MKRLLLKAAKIKSENTHKGLHEKTVPQTTDVGKRREFQDCQVFINSRPESLKFQRSAPTCAPAGKQDGNLGAVNVV